LFFFQKGDTISIKSYKKEKTMSSIKKLRGLGAALVVLVALSSCTNSFTDFFSTSWGEAFRRSPKDVKVTSSNVYELLHAARGNPELARGILDGIDPETTDLVLKRAAIKAANQAADLTGLVLQNAKILLDAVDSGSTDALDNLIKAISDQAKKNDVVGISKKTVEILGSEVKIVTNPIEAGKITATASKADGDTADVDITINNKTNDVTVEIDGFSYKGTINTENQTITLPNAGQGGQSAVINYTENGDTVILTDLDKIPSAGLASGPVSADTIVGKPVFKDDDFLTDVPDSDLTLLVVTLVMGKVEKESLTLDEYIEKLATKDLETGAGNLDEDEKVIAAIVNGMVDRGDDTSELTGMLTDLLKGGN
jgi:hypothetical protein